jgi:hypothetical protein
MEEECEELQGLEGPAEKSTAAMAEVVVKEGFEGEDIRTKFVGKVITLASNHAKTGANSREWHNWILYGIPPEDQKDAIFRVVDQYKTKVPGKCNHTELTLPLTAQEVAVKYPRLANAAIADGALGEEVFTLDASKKREVK